MDQPLGYLEICGKPLGKSMAKAQAEGRLFKEQQFMIGVPASEMGHETLKSWCWFRESLTLLSKSRRDFC